jgi:membrane protease YdiL (CAAX protease family)
MTPCQRSELGGLLAIGILPYLLNGFYNPILAATPARFWAVEVTTWIVMPTAILLIARQRALIASQNLGPNADVLNAPRPMVLALLVILFSVGLYYLDRASVRLGLIWWPNNPGAIPFQYGQMLPRPGPRTGWLRLLALLHYCITAGVVEEIYYRGMMRRLFSPGWKGAAGFLIVSSVIFTAVHFEGGLVRMFEALTWGAVAGLLYLGTGNLWPLILAHVIVDCLWLIQS